MFPAPFDIVALVSVAAAALINVGVLYSTVRSVKGELTELRKVFDKFRVDTVIQLTRLETQAGSNPDRR